MAKNYLDAEEFKNEILICQEHGYVSDKLGMMFRKLCWKNSGAFSYVDNDDREDCISTAVLQCINSFQKYNAQSSDNAFAYFTRVALNGLKAGWNKLHRHKSREYRLDQIFHED